MKQRNRLKRLQQRGQAFDERMAELMRFEPKRAAGYRRPGSLKK